MEKMNARVRVSCNNFSPAGAVCFFDTDSLVLRQQVTEALFSLADKTDMGFARVKAGLLVVNIRLHVPLASLGIGPAEDNTPRNQEIVNLLRTAFTDVVPMNLWIE